MRPFFKTKLQYLTFGLRVQNIHIHCLGNFYQHNINGCLKLSIATAYLLSSSRHINNLSRYGCRIQMISEGIGHNHSVYIKGAAYALHKDYLKLNVKLNTPCTKGGEI
jgi:hypothetical protein